MAELSNILSAFGLSASAGLNAYIPLLIVALTARAFPNVLSLNEPFDLLASNWSIAALVVLLVVELLADKVPAVDHVNDVIGMFIRPAAGAVLFAGTTSGAIENLDPRLALLCGLLVAGTTHGVKATARPVVTASTGGVGNPIVSTLEDVAAFLTSMVALLAPLLIGVAIVLFGILFVWWLFRRRTKKSAAGAGAGGG
jgi:cytochrome bd-type quinol oxidase subunit 2